jgi:hypothetical protein
LQLCNFATLQFCNFATLQLCNFATLQLCNFAFLLFSLNILEMGKTFVALEIKIDRHF